MSLFFLPNRREVDAAFTRSFGQAIIDGNQSRLENYELADEAYGGNLNTPALTQRNDQTEDNIFVNLPKLVVDRQVDFLFGNEIDFIVGDKRTKSPAQKYLDKLWSPLERQTFLKRLGIFGGKYGTCYVSFDEENGQIIRKAEDPREMTIFVDMDNNDLITAYQRDWTSYDFDTREFIHRRTIWNLKVGKWRRNEYIVYSEDQPTLISSKDWQYKSSPIVHWQNYICVDSPYGLSDIEEDLRQLVRSINRTLSLMHRVARIYSYKKPYVLGVNPDLVKEIKLDAESMLSAPIDGKLGVLETKADIDGLTKLLAEQMRFFHMQSCLPEVALGSHVSLGDLRSGLALKILLAPTIDRINTKRTLAGEGLANVNQVIMEMGGYNNKEVQTVWQPLVPQDMLQNAQIAQIWSALGVSKESVYSLLLDLDPEVEKSGTPVEMQMGNSQTNAQNGTRQNT